MRRLQETCLKAEELLGHASQLGYGPARGVGAAPGGSGGGGGGGPALHVERLQGIDLMVRTVKTVISSRL